MLSLSLSHTHTSKAAEAAETSQAAEAAEAAEAPEAAEAWEPAATVTVPAAYTRVHGGNPLKVPASTRARTRARAHTHTLAKAVT